MHLKNCLYHALVRIVSDYKDFYNINEVHR